MTRLPILVALALTAALSALAVHAETAAKKAAPAHKVALAKPAAAEPEETLNPNQLDISARVLTGRADCEFNQKVDVEAMPERPGHFRVAFAKQQFTMVPEETTTGAIRLVDRKAGVLWLQIPVKSMLINTKAGHRMVDACMHSEQRAAVDAAEAAAKSGTSRQ